MQKKLIAVAVAGLMSGVAFAQATSVTVGGKFDACYSFSRANTAANDVEDPTKETLDGGCNSTTRISIGAKEEIAKGYDIRVDFDLRFGNVHEGKNTTTTGGINSNDKKAMAFTTPFGTLQWGTANLMSNDYKLAEKPYMVTPKDTELVKFGVSQWREESLSNRNTSYWSPVLKMGPVETLVKATLALSDARKNGTNDVAGQNQADAKVIGLEGKLFGGVADFGIDTTSRGALTTAGGNGGSSMSFQHYYVNVRPIPGNKNLKLSAQYNRYSGWAKVGGVGSSTASTIDGAFKDKTTNFVVSYNFNGKAEAGVGVSHLSDMSEARNGGKSIMIGGSYFLSKSVQVYANLRKDDWKHYQAAETGGKYVGTGANFAGNTSAKADGHTIKVGIMKEF